MKNIAIITAIFCSARFFYSNLFFRNWLVSKYIMDWDLSVLKIGAFTSMLAPTGLYQSKTAIEAVFVISTILRYNWLNMIIDIVKVFTASSIAFVVGMLITPVVTHYLYKFRTWKKKAGKVAPDGRSTPIFNKVHEERETSTPRMGGIVIWVSAFITIIGIWFVSKIFPSDITTKLDFLSRNQTWIPLFTLIAGGVVGMIDDILEVKGNGSHIAGGLSLKKRLIVVGVISFFVAWWFFAKLGVASIGFPFLGDIAIGFWFIPFFMLVTLAVYAGGVIDGIDGLSGGVFAAMFTAYAGIAFYQQQINLAAFSALIVGGILAFLWFNIPPARFYMSETGTMGLTITLTVVAFMTDSLGGGHGVFVLPIVAFPLVITVLSVVIQLLSKKFRNGKKIFQVAPIHHHFEAIGWPAYKVTMRYWVISIVFAIIGLSIALIG